MSKAVAAQSRRPPPAGATRLPVQPPKAANRQACGGNPASWTSVQVRLQGDAKAVQRVLDALPTGWVADIGWRDNRDGTQRAYGTIVVMED